MSQKANPKLVGGFVMGALALLVTAILVFGSGQVFKEYVQAVIFFQGSVGGLRPGATVDFRGVQIGMVKDISIEYDPKRDQFLIPVVINVDPRRVTQVGDPGKRAPYTLQSLIERGLRAELRLQSLVTGQMAVQLNFYPGTEARLIGSNLPYPEIPAVPSTFEQAQEIFTEIGRQAPELLAKFNLLLDRGAAALQVVTGNADQIKEAIGSTAKFAEALGGSDQDLRGTLSGANQLLTNLNAMTRNLDHLVNNADDATGRFGKLLADNAGEIHAMVTQLNKASAGLSQLTERLNAALQEDRGGLRDFSNTGLYDLMNLIRDTQELVGNINRTVEDLRRNPSQFLFGQQQRDMPASRAKSP